MNISSRVIFQGEASLCLTGNIVDVILVEHPSFRVIEIVTYDHMIDREAPRLYVGSKAIIAELNRQGIKKQLRIARKSSPTVNEQIVVYKAIFDLITQQLIVTDFSLPKRVFAVTIDVRKQWEVVKPKDLAVYRSLHFDTLL